MNIPPALATRDDWYQFSTRDGLLVRVRPEEEGDTPYLVDLFNRLSADSRYLRFSKSMVDPDPERVRGGGTIGASRPAAGNGLAGIR